MNTFKMSLSAEFRRSIKPLIIMNSIFATGLMEYFVCDKINAIGLVYASISIIFYVSMTFFSSEFFLLNTIFKQSFVLKLTYLFYVYNGYVSYVATIIIGILRRKVNHFVLLIYSIHSDM